MNYKDYLTKTRYVIRLKRWVESLLWMGTFVLISAAVLYAGSAGTPSGGLLQSLLGLVFVLGVIFAIFRGVVVPLFRPVSLCGLIDEIEKNHPEIQERLSTVHYLDEQIGEVSKFRYSPELVEETRSWTEREIGPEYFKSYYSWADLKRPALTLSLVALGWVLIFLFNFQGVVQAWSGYRIALGSHSIQISTIKIDTSGNLEVPLGQPVRLTAKVYPAVDSTRIHFQSQDYNWQTGDMSSTSDDGHLFFFDLPPVMAQTSYYVSAKGSASSISWIRPIEPPRIEKFVFQVVPPAYTGLSKCSMEQLKGDLEAPLGSRIELSLTANNDLDSAEIRISNHEIQSLSLSGPRSASGSIHLNTSIQYFINLKDRHGFEAENLGPYHLVPQSDQLPQIFIHYPPLVYNFTDRPFASIDWEAVDDYGITQVDLRYQLNYMNLVRSIPLARVASMSDGKSSSDRIFEATSNLRQVFPWDLSSLELLPGDEVSYFLVVYDNDAISGPKAATSETHLLRFPTPMDRYGEVELEEVSYIDKLDELLEQQRKIRKDTEKLREIIEDQKLQPDSSLKNQEKDSAQWQQQQKMEELKGEQEDLGKQLENLQKDIQQTLDRLNDPDAFSMKTLQKMAKIEDLMNQLLTDEMKQVLSQFQRTLNEMSKNQPVQSIENLDLSIQDFEENLDRMLNLLENSMLERQIETMIQQVEALKQQQDTIEQDTERLESESEDLAEDDSLSPDEKAAQQAELEQQKEELEARQKQLEEKIQELLEQMEKLAQEQSSKNEKLSEGLKEALKQADREKLSESLEKSLEQLQSGQLQRARESQQQASQALSQMQMNLSSLMESMGGMDFQRDLADLRRVLDRALILSERQEKVVRELAPGGQVLQSWPLNLKNEVSILQNYYRNETLRIENQLRELGKKDPFLDFQAIQEFRLAARAMDRAVGTIENQLPHQGAAFVPQVKSQAQLGLDKVNTALLILLDNLESMAQAQSSCSMEGYFNSLEQLIGQQRQLNQRTRQQQQMRQRGQVPDWRQQMEKLAKEQAAIRRQVQELFRKYGKLEELLGKLDKVGDQMMDVEKDLTDQQADEKVQEKQQEILTRLLDAEKSIQEQGQSKERESETAGAYEAPPSPELPESLETIKSRVQKLRQGVGEDRVPPEYRQRVRSYFERLSEE